MRRRVVWIGVGALVVALVAAGVVTGLRWWSDAHRSELERAASYAPADAQRLSWTDWAAVRAELGADLDASSSTNELADLLDRGYEADLTSTSALVLSAPVLQERFGFSPASVEWELFSQAVDGAVVILSLPDDTDFADLADRLERLGYTRPDSADGVWLGGEEALPRIGAQLTPELQYVALDAADHLVLTSDDRGYLASATATLGEGELPRGVQDVLAASGEPLTAATYDGDYACSALAMGQADAEDQAQAEALVEAAGGVDPVTGFAISGQPDGRVRVALAFADEDRARANADSRSTLASGAAPGQGGDFGDRFRVDAATARGRVVTLDLAPRAGSYVLSDLSSGPVLFATC